MFNKEKKYKAFLFDMNGTMVDDMDYHIRAWHRILTGLGATLSLERMKEECYGKNSELLERILPGRFTDSEKEKMSLEKEIQYQREFKPNLQLIKGLRNFLERAHEQGIKNGIGSAAIQFNIDFVLDGMRIRDYIDVIVSADDVRESKPHPETFLSCAEQLNISPGDCLVFEDAPKGVEAALQAGMDCMVITTMHREEEFESLPNIVGFIRDYTDPVLSGYLKK